MSRTKAVHIFDRMVWVWDNAHDIVLAHLVEVAESGGYSTSAFLSDWRVWASSGDLSLTYPDKHTPSRDEMAVLFADVRSRIVEHGDVVSSDLEQWSVLPGELVSGGFLRSARLPVGALVDVVDSFTDLIAGSFPADPAGAAWFIGAGEERRAIPMRGSGRAFK